MQPDTVIPDLSSSQSWNRFSYTSGNPIRYSDPTGHKAIGDNEGGSQPCYPGELTCQMKKDGYRAKSSEQIKKEIKQSIHKKLEDLIEGIGYYVQGSLHPYSPMSAGNQICQAATAKGIPCDPNVVDFGVDIGIKGVNGFATLMSQPTSIYSPTPYFNSPTPSLPMSTATPHPTSTLTPDYVTASTNTSTSTSTATPSLTATQQIFAPSATPTSPYTTPTYWTPSITTSPIATPFYPQP